MTRTAGAAAIHPTGTSHHETASRLRVPATPSAALPAMPGGSRTGAPVPYTADLALSTDGSALTAMVPSAPDTSDPSTGRLVTIAVPRPSPRYVPVNVIASTGWDATQISEFGVYPN